MTYVFESTERNEGYVLNHWTGSSFEGRGFAGPDVWGQYWMVAQEGLNHDTVARRLDAKGNLIQDHTVSGSNANTVGCTAIDKYGFLWIGNTDEYEVVKVGPDGSVLATVRLKISTIDYRPVGAIALNDGYIYWVALSPTGFIYVFKVDVTPGSESVSSYGTSLASAGSVVDRFDIVRTYNAAAPMYCVDPNRTSALIKISSILTPSTQAITWSTGSPAGGLLGYCRAFGYDWVGNDRTQGVGSGDPQIIKLTPLTSFVQGVLVFSDALKISEIVSDGEYLYAAVSGKVAGLSTVGDNRIEKIDPGTFTVVGTFPFDGGDGEDLRTIIAISDSISSYPVASLVDAVVWFHGDDPSIVRYFASVAEVYNKGPQSEVEIIPTGGTIALETLGVLPAFGLVTSKYFDLSGPSYKFLHDGSPWTVALAFQPRSFAAAYRPLVSTIPSGVANTDTGTVIYYDQTNGKIHVVIANGSGVDYVLELETAASAVTVLQQVVVVIRFDPDATAEAEIRVYDSNPLAEVQIFSGSSTAQTPAAADVTDLFVGSDTTVNGNIYLGELAILKRRLEDSELPDLVNRMRRYTP